MPEPSDTAALLDELKSRAEITEVVLRYCRGIDRCDEALLRACFHSDASHRHGGFEGASAESYEISPNEAVMKFSDQRRGFSPQEAAGVQKLLDTLSLYCAESVIWWEHGEGVKLDGKGNEQTPPKKKAPTGAEIALLR